MSRINQDYKQRKEAGGQTIWHPLPSNILQNIFDDDLRSVILNKFFDDKGNFGYWNVTYGYYAHKQSGLLFCLAATEEGLITINRFIKENGNVWNIKQDDTLDTGRKLPLINKLADVIGRSIALVQPADFNTGNISELVNKHCKPNPGYVFVRDQGSNYPGTIRVRSLQTEKSTVDLPGSHPDMILEHKAQAAQESVHSKNRFALSKSLLDAIYETPSSTKYVPNVNPQPTVPIEDHLVHKDGAYEFLPNGPKQNPLLIVGNDTVGHTASVVYRGTPHESTLTALASNPLVTQPSSSFNPHPYWLSSIFVSPINVLRDPKASAAIIAIALLYSNKSSTQYITNVNKLTTVIDNEEIDKDLYGG